MAQQEQDCKLICKFEHVLALLSEWFDRGDDSDQCQGTIVHEAQLCNSVAPAESHQETQSDSPSEREGKKSYEWTTPDVKVAVCSSNKVFYFLLPQLLEVVEKVANEGQGHRD